MSEIVHVVVCAFFIAIVDVSIFFFVKFFLLVKHVGDIDIFFFLSSTVVMIIVKAYLPLFVR